MKSRYSFYEKITDPNIGKTVGFVNREDIKTMIMGENDTYYKIEQGYEFRPDLISQKMYGTTEFHWVLTFINDISNSPEGYTAGRILRIPQRARILQAL